MKLQNFLFQYFLLNTTIHARLKGIERTEKIVPALSAQELRWKRKNRMIQINFLVEVFSTEPRLSGSTAVGTKAKKFSFEIVGFSSEKK